MAMTGCFYKLEYTLENENSHGIRLVDLSERRVISVSQDFPLSTNFQGFPESKVYV